MKKLIKLEFDNTTRERKTENSYSELYSHDKNNGSFEFEILNDTLTTEQVIALFKFTESNKIWKTTGTVEGNKVNVTFDTSLITQNETVICYLYLDEEQRTSDTFRFKFKVKVSEIDKMNRYEVKERFINNTVIVDRLDVVTKDELKEALKNVGGIATEGLLTEVKAEEIYAKKSEAVDNTNFELVKNRVLALELKTDKDTVYDDSELRGRVSVLEAKHDNDTIYDDTNVRERLTALESKPNVDVNNLVTKDELASKNYLTEHQDTSNFALKSEIPQQYNDTEVKERLTTLENKAPVDLSNYATKEELRNVSGSQPLAVNLVTKEELEAKHYVTEEALNNKAYLTSHQDLSNYALKSEIPQPYNDSPLTERVTALESKAIEGGAYDDSDLRNRVVALESKEDKDTKYDDTDLKNRVTNLENKPPLDTSEFVTNQALESKGYIKDVSNLVTKDELETKGYLTQHQSLDGYVKKSELGTLPTNQTLSIDNNTLSISGGNSVELPVNRYEIHGTGMPNGVVEAEIGTTYVDKNKTNGALKWIKTTDGGNTGWKVFTGDTGWRTLPLRNNRDTAKLQIRRINDEIIVKFDGLQWGWFGVADMNKQEGNIVDKTIGGKQYTWIKLNIGQGNNVLPEGFRSASSLLSGLYGDLGDLLGSVYVGGTADSNAIQLRYAMTRNELTSNILSQIRISPITFVTDDGWPVQLP